MTASGSEPVRSGSVGPGGEESYDYQQIMKMLHGLEPEKASMAGDLFLNLAGQLESLRGALQTAGEQAGGKWSGSAAEAAMKQIQQLHDQTAQLAAQSRTAGNTMRWLGGDVMPKFAQIPSPQVATGWKEGIAAVSAAVQSADNPDNTTGLTNHPGQGGVIDQLKNGGPGARKANSAAQDYLRTFNGHLQTANNAMPKSLATPATRQENPWDTSSGGHSGSGTGGTGAGAGSGYASAPSSNVSGGGTGVPGYSSSSANPFASAKTASGGSVPSFSPSSQGHTPPATGSLQGYTAPSSGTTSSPFASGMPPATGGGSANPFARASMMPGVGSGFGGSRGSSEDISPEGNVPEEDNSPWNAPGEDAAGSGTAGSEAAGAARAEGEGASGMPMGAGGGGGDSGDKERQRQAWMNEDKSIWGLPDEEIGSTIG